MFLLFIYFVSFIVVNKKEKRLFDWYMMKYTAAVADACICGSVHADAYIFSLSHCHKCVYFYFRFVLACLGFALYCGFSFIWAAINDANSYFIVQSRSKKSRYTKFTIFYYSQNSLIFGHSTKDSRSTLINFSLLHHQI